jgi:hypothetical protein
LSSFHSLKTNLEACWTRDCCASATRRAKGAWILQSA